jgi:anthranilate phosphoribosyltransferase
VKFFFNEGEKIIEPVDFGMSALTYENIKGGQSVEESAKIFMKVLEGSGTGYQNDAVVANAAMALYAADRKSGLMQSVEKAREALNSGKALRAFKNLIGGQK